MRKLIGKFEGSDNTVYQQTVRVLGQADIAISVLNAENQRNKQKLINPSSGTDYSKQDWQYAVQRGATELGYREWVNANLQLETCDEISASDKETV